MRILGLALIVVTVAACGTDATDSTSEVSTTSTSAPESAPTTTAPTSALATAETGFEPAPKWPEGPISEDLQADIDAFLEGVFTTSWDVDRVDALVESGDPRLAWLIVDLLRFYQGGPAAEKLISAYTQLTGARSQPGAVDFVWTSNNLIAWDMPAWDGYPDTKRRVYGVLEPDWAAFFDEDHGIDWRYVTWGGVLPDHRELGDMSPCNCIPALDHPETTSAAGGDWYPDDRIVFGIVLDGDAIALPKHQMEVHEMVNLTLGGRELGIPYCTLCGSAQAYLVDDVAGVERLVLRTSGLLQRSNKLMYDRVTGSAIDTFTGEALTGPLAEAGVVLEQVTVVAVPWGEWKQAHPTTEILAEDGGIGRSYAPDPLGGRDDHGPIFPVGDIDPRLPVQEAVIGVVTPDGTPVAFPVAETSMQLKRGDIEWQGLTVREEDGIRIYHGETELASHQAFWFAWSQFHEGTELWYPPGS
ncbi:MAG: DUF3179 domain-containing (seleno)protein [Acidimicrobiia bacterium]|nr:DUF3179 domain-containing (seleno)protein [Acidimicrobiia bacterium]